MTSPAQPPNTNDYPDQPMTLAAMDGFGDGGTNPDPFAYSDQHGQVAGQPDPVADFAAANHDPSAMEAMLSHTHPVDMDLEGVQKKAGGGNTKVRATMVKSNVSDRGDDSCKSMPMRCQCPICLELHAMFGHRNSDATNDEEPAESLFSYSLSDDDAHGSHGDSPHVYDGCGPIADIISVTTPTMTLTTTTNQEAHHGHHDGCRRGYHRPKCSALKWIRLRSSRLKQIKVVAKTIKRGKGKGKCGKCKCGKVMRGKNIVDLLESSDVE